MEREEQKLHRNIKTVYTKIAKALIDPHFKFPEGGKVNITLQNFVKQLKESYGDCKAERIVDYCIFQLHKNQNSDYQNRLAVTAFGKIAFQKFVQMSSKGKKFMEDKWLATVNLSRASLKLLIVSQKEHPQAKYIYMPSEEGTKKRWLNTEVGLMMCATSTLMWSPFSPTCQQCNNAGRCKVETQSHYPELYRIRLESYGKGKE